MFLAVLSELLFKFVVLTNLSLIRDLTIMSIGTVTQYFVLEK